MGGKCGGTMHDESYGEFLLLDDSKSREEIEHEEEMERLQAEYRKIFSSLSPKKQRELKRMTWWNNIIDWAIVLTIFFGPVVYAILFWKV